MKKFINKYLRAVIFPSLLFAAAALPFSCNLSRDGGVFKSKDGGNSWTQMAKTNTKATIGSITTFSMAIDQTDPNIIYLGTGGSGIYKSTDEATTWVQINDPKNTLAKNANVYDLKIDPFNANTVFAAVFQNNYGRILRSDDKGQSWLEIYVAAKQGIVVKKIEIDKLNSNILYAISYEGGLLKSSDKGITWQTIKWFGENINDFAIDSRDNGMIYVATANGVIQKSADFGLNWQTLGQNSGNYFASGIQGLTHVAIDEQNSDVIYAWGQAGIMTSGDAGVNWSNMNILAAPGSSSISAFTQDRLNPAIIYCAINSLIYKTTNYGLSWSVQQIAISRQVNFIKIDPMSSYIVYAGMGG